MIQTFIVKEKGNLLPSGFCLLEGFFSGVKTKEEAAGPVLLEQERLTVCSVIVVCV